MRRAAVAALAVPVLAVVYLSALLRRSLVARIAISLVLGAFVGIGVLATSAPAPTTATPPTKHVPLTSVAFRTDLRTGLEPDAPIAIEFSTPMNERSVDVQLEVVPATPVALEWNDDATALTIRPKRTWATSTLHTITVPPGALAQSGRPLSAPARAVFLTRPATTVRIDPTSVAGDRVRPDTAFLVTFDRPVDPASVRAAFVTTPATPGTLERLGRRTGETWRFTPTAPLAPDAELIVRVGPTVRDATGAPIAEAAALTVVTVPAPKVLRFRPADSATRVDRDQTVSVRFSEPMARAATKGAFAVTADGTPVDGKVSFAEDDTVLVFDPADRLGYSAKVVVTLSTDAVSKDGVALATAASATFRTAPKPKPKPPAPATKISTGGGSVGSGSWKAVESYYLKLMNCTRTGGWVTSTGNCSSPGGRAVAALKLSAGISDKVSRPYAKLLATKGLCDHFIGGNPGDRLRRAGYTSYIWAENLGCRSGDPYKAVLGSHLYFQSEKSYNGGHYVNLMNAKYDRVGIGVWVSSGRVRLVVDFYHPR